MTPDTLTPDTAARALVRHHVETAATLVASALDALAEAEAMAPDVVTREVCRLAEADATALLGRLHGIAHRVEHPRPPEGTP